MGSTTWTSECPVARTLDIVGDRWSLLIVRDALEGLRRFGEFQRSLGVAKNILSSRLRALVEAGVLVVQPASDGSNFSEYVLTEQGRDLFDVMVSLRQWGQSHTFEPGQPYAHLVDPATGQPLPRLRYTTPDGRAIGPADARVRLPGGESGR